MPELPEVEAARRLMQRMAAGKTITALGVLHPSLRRRLPLRSRRAVLGHRVERVDRHGKHQLLHLSGGAALHVHFRMSGDWQVDRVGEPLPKFARAWFELSDGTRLVLEDARALSTIALVRSATPMLPALGPEPLGEEFTAATLAAALKRRRRAIKPVLLDQRVVAGLGNIYAAEALWCARISPWAIAAKLSRLRVERLVSSVRSVLSRALRSADGTAAAFAVYGRAGRPCRRCGRRIRRLTQAGRSTYYCPRCQRV